jgi:hypothetical protein
MTALIAASACRPTEDSWARRAAQTLGASDGYVFVFSPFNCSLKAEQIDAMNELATRQRRSGRVLTVGHEIADSATASEAVADLGIRLRASPLAATPLGRSSQPAGLHVPLVIAIRDGEVIAILSGADAGRLDTWLAWLEHRSEES